MNQLIPRTILLAMIAGLPASSPAATTYTVVDLGPGSARDINASGKVVGNAAAGGWYYDGTTRTALSTSCRYLGGPPEQVFNQPATAAYGINDAGVIVGQITFPGPTYTPFVQPPGVVGTLLGIGTSTAVNAAGTAVGGVGSHAFILALGGATVTPPAGPSAQPLAINDSGIVVGSVAPGNIEVAAILGSASSTPLDLSGLALPAPGGGGYYVSQARSVNNSGLIVGEIQYVSGNPVAQSVWAFVYAGGSATSLGTLGGTTAAANDINSDGIVVGTARIAAGADHAFVYSGGAMSDLNTLLSAGGAGWVLNSANALNDGGMIVGEGTLDGVQHAFLLKPASTGLPPSIVFQPKAASVFAGEAFSLAVTASGSPDLSYQWQHAGTNLPSATARTYDVTHATPDDAGTYRVIVSNGNGSTPSDPAQVEVKLVAHLDIDVYAGLLVSGPVGLTFQIEAVEQAGDTNWQPLGTVTLDVSPVFYLDRSTPLHHTRIYRAVQVLP